MAKRGTDLMARRKGESQWAWRSRLAALKQADEIKNEPIVTPETKARAGGDLQEQWILDDDGRFAQTLQRKRRSALAHMNERGSLSDEQFYSALQIARIVERLELDNAVKSASMEARVDMSRTPSTLGLESLYTVRAEAAYTAWRARLPVPRRMIIDMITRDYRLKAIASRYHIGWPKAQRLLRNALEDWPDYFAHAMRKIDQDDVDEIHSRLTRAPKCA